MGAQAVVAAVAVSLSICHRSLCMPFGRSYRREHICSASLSLAHSSSPVDSLPPYDHMVHYSLPSETFRVLSTGLHYLLVAATAFTLPSPFSDPLYSSLLLLL